MAIKKITGIAVALVLIMGQVMPTFADTRVIGRDKALDMALTYSEALESFDDNVLMLEKSFAQVNKMANSAKSYDEALSDIYKMYSALGQPVPDKYDMSTEDEFNQLYAVRIQAANLGAQLQELKNTRETVVPQMASGLDQLMSNYFYLSDMVDMQVTYLAIQEDQLKDTTLKYELGLVSENDYLDAKNNYDSANYQMKQLVINRDNLDLQLRLMTGVADGEKVTWEDTYLTDIDRSLEEYEVYRKLAFENRVDYKNALIEVETADQVLDFYMSALYDISNKIKGEIGVKEAQMNLDAVTLDVEQDMFATYQDVIQLSKTMEIEQLKLFQAKAQANQAKLSFDKGLMNESSLRLAEFGVQSQEVALNKIERELVIALDELKRSTVQ